MSESHSLQVAPETSMAERFRLARGVAGLGQLEAAAALGVSVSTYARIEEGARAPRRGEIIAMAHITGQSLSFFIGSSVDSNGADGPHTEAQSAAEINPEAA